MACSSARAPRSPRCAGAAAASSSTSAALPARMRLPAGPPTAPRRRRWTTSPKGCGGMGEVFRARDTKVGRTIALKIVDPRITANPALLSRLLEDARAAAKLSHPNIATLWEIGEDAGRHYLAYEFAAGHTLREEA